MKTRLSKKAKEAADDRRCDRYGHENTLRIYCEQYLLPDKLLALERLGRGAYYWILGFHYPWKSARFYIENSLAITADGSMMYQLQPLDKDFNKFRLAWIEPPHKLQGEIINEIRAMENPSEHPRIKEWIRRASQEIMTGEEVSAAERWLPLQGKFKIGDEITYDQLVELIMTGPHCHRPEYKVKKHLRPIEIAVSRLGSINYAGNILIKKMRVIRERIVKKHGRQSDGEIEALCVRNSAFVALREAYNVLVLEGRRAPEYQKAYWKHF